MLVGPSNSIRKVHIYFATKESNIVAPPASISRLCARVLDTNGPVPTFRV